jgi:hypothetical protein
MSERMTELSKPVVNPDQFVAWTDDEMMVEAIQRRQKARLSLIELAEIVGAMYRREMDMTPLELPDAVLNELRFIESGQVYGPMAEAYMHTNAYPHLKRLVIDDQKKLVKTGTVGLVIKDGRRFDFRQMKLTVMSKEQLRLAFDRGRIRSREEMTTILESESPESPDEFNEATVCVKIVAEIDMTKAQRKRLNELKERAGSMSALVQRLILKSV